MFDYLFLLGKYLCCERKYALEVMGPVTVSFCRYGIALICLYGILKLKGCHKKVQKEHWPYLMILGGLGYFAAIILQLAGTARLSGSLSSLMNSLNPVAISVMAAIFFKGKDHMEKCDRHCYISCRRICYFRNGRAAG